MRTNESDGATVGEKNPRSYIKNALRVEFSNWILQFSHHNGRKLSSARLGPGTGSGGLSTISRRFNTACGQIITLLVVVVGGVRAAAALVVVVGWLAGCLATELAGWLAGRLPFAASLCPAIMECD